MPLDRFELRVQRQGPGKVHHDLSRPVDAEVGEADFAHHRVARFVPELPGHVAVITPGSFRCLGDDARHHLRHVHFAKPLVKHHQRLRLGRELFVVEKHLGVHAHVVGVRESLVPFRPSVVLVGPGGTHPGNFLATRFFAAVQRAGRSQAIVEQ